MKNFPGKSKTNKQKNQSSPCIGLDDSNNVNIVDLSIL